MPTEVVAGELDSLTIADLNWWEFYGDEVLKGFIEHALNNNKDILAAAERMSAEVFLPPLSLCGDNAAMIGAQAYYEYIAGNIAGMDLNAYATKSILGEKI